MTVTWLPGPVVVVAIGNLVGSRTWCAICRAEVDHNAAWHTEAAPEERPA